MAPVLPALASAGTLLSAAAPLTYAAMALKKPKAPKVEKPAVMPTADDEAVRAAERRRRAQLSAQSGRASTILSEGDALGG